jgi:hypothetical protein
MNRIKIVIILFALLTLFFISSCKRASVEDPSMLVNSGFRVILSGIASPSTLYVPDDNSAFSTNLYIQAKDNKGSVLVGYQVILEQLGPVFGYFDNQKLSITKTTDVKGYINVNYAFPAGIYISDTQYVKVRATLVDDGRLDPETYASSINDEIPIKIVMNDNTYVDKYMLHGDINESSGSGLSGVTVTITNYGSTGTYSFSNKPSGSYEIMVPKGWTGTITPTKSGYTFTPANIKITKPMSGALMWEDFSATSN